MTASSRSTARADQRPSRRGAEAVPSESAQAPIAQEEDDWETWNAWDDEDSWDAAYWRADLVRVEDRTDRFYNVTIAVKIPIGKLELLRKKKNRRLVLWHPAATPPRVRAVRSVVGGMLVQDQDTAIEDLSRCKRVTMRAPTDAELRAMDFAWRVVKHVKSNAIVFARDGATAGVGAGQMNRRDSARIAAMRAGEAAQAAGWDAPRTQGSAMASDAFFPFRDGIDAAAEAGVAGVIQPGGSMRDEEVIAAADEHGMAMVFTGIRHFRH